jgi:hypothetical protein
MSSLLLTPKQQKFVSIFTNPSSPTFFNATRTVRLIYNVKNDNSAAVIGSKLLRSVKVRQKIKELLNDIQAYKLITVGLKTKLSKPYSYDWLQTVEYLSRVMGY